LETKFVQCELEKPSENPEKWINKLIKINQRIESCYPSQKKSDVMMIAHILSRLPKEEKYYKNFVAMSRRFGYSKQSIFEFKREVCDYWECNIQGMAQERTGEEQVQTVNVGKMEVKQDAKWHGKQQEEGNYCYIDLFEEEFEECELEAQEEETDLNREENEEAEKGEQELSEDLLKDGEDESIREEDAEDKKFPMETRVKDKEIHGEEDVNRILEHVVIELKEAEKEEERKNIINEEEESFICEEQSHQEDFRVEDKCLIRDEEKEKEEANDKIECLNGEEENIKIHEKRVGQDEIDEDFKDEEKSLIGEEDVDMEEFHKEEEDIFPSYLSDEETEDFAEEEKLVQEMKEMGKVPNKQELEKQIVFKVEREAVSRVKEKPD